MFLQKLCSIFTCVSLCINISSVSQLVAVVHYLPLGSGAESVLVNSEYYPFPSLRMDIYSPTDDSLEMVKQVEIQSIFDTLYYDVTFTAVQGSGSFYLTTENAAAATPDTFSSSRIFHLSLRELQTKMASIVFWPKSTFIGDEILRVEIKESSEGRPLRFLRLIFKACISISLNYKQLRPSSPFILR